MKGGDGGTRGAGVGPQPPSPYAGKVGVATHPARWKCGSGRCIHFYALNFCKCQGRVLPRIIQRPKSTPPRVLLGWVSPPRVRCAWRPPRVLFGRVSPPRVRCARRPSPCLLSVFPTRACARAGAPFWVGSLSRSSRRCEPSSRPCLGDDYTLVYLSLDESRRLATGLVDHWQLCCGLGWLCSSSSISAAQGRPGPGRAGRPACTEAPAARSSCRGVAV